MAQRRRRLLGTTLATALVVAGLALSTASDVQAATPPTQPREVAVEPKNQSARVSWRPPSGTEGAPVDKYKVVRWAADIPRTSYVLGPDLRAFVVPDLLNGTPYFFIVAAHNSAGWGPASAKVKATPRTVPSAPLGLQATLDNRTAALTWSPPASDGGESVDAYRVERSADGGAWSNVASPLTTHTSIEQLDYGVAYRFRARARNDAGVSRPSNVAKVAPVPPECPDPLPTAGPYLQLSCDSADGIVVHTCTNPDWEDLNQIAADGCEAALQMPMFVPSNAQGDDAATAYADRLSGSYWLTGYPGARGPDDWWKVDPLLVPLSARCDGTPSWGCPGNVPQDPMPSLSLDFTAAPGDLPRRAVANPANASRFDITYRARVVTTAPVAITFFGVECLLEIDSTAGTTPDLKVHFSVAFPHHGWDKRGEFGNLIVSDLQDSDWDVSGNFVCDSQPPPTYEIQDFVVETLSDHIAEAVDATCGATDPYWWQTCRTIVDGPPDPPPSPEPVPSCPDSPPPAGPYMTTSCDPTTGDLVKTCHPGWLDTNGLIPDGCERRTGGLVDMRLNNNSDQALADRISGSFSLGGYPGGTGTGTKYLAPNPQRQALPACTDNLWGCWSDFVQTPMPELELDLTLESGDDTRAVGQYDAGQSAIFVGLRAGIRTSGNVAFRHAGVNCQISIDSARGASDEILFVVAAQGSGTGPLQIGGVLPDTLVQMDPNDILIGPHRWCNYYASARVEHFRTWIRDQLIAWAAAQGRLCGAPRPYFWQGCP